MRQPILDQTGAPVELEIVKCPISLNVSELSGAIRDRPNGQALGLVPDILCPRGSARRTGCEKKATVAYRDLVQLLGKLALKALRCEIPCFDHAMFRVGIPCGTFNAESNAVRPLPFEGVDLAGLSRPVFSPEHSKIVESS